MNAAPSVTQRYLHCVIFDWHVWGLWKNSSISKCASLNTEYLHTSVFSKSISSSPYDDNVLLQCSLSLQMKYILKQ